MKTPSAELTAKIENYARRHKGKFYAPIPHPAFAHVPYRHGPERFDMIAPHLGFRNGTVLDIGSRFGYIAHRLEDMGYAVTAVEVAKDDVYFLKAIRDLCERKFEVIHDSVFNLEKLDYDLVFALNIFHHFMKSRETFEQLDDFLGRLKCRMMIYQAHNPRERQMAGAWRNMSPDEAVQYLSQKLSLPRITEIGSLRKTRKLLNVTIPRILEVGSYRRRRRLFKLSE
jgi:SAM-dependent methyltransferase